MSTLLEARPSTTWYSQLLGKVDEQILHLQDTRGTFLLDKLDERNLKFFTRQIQDKPWANHFMLVVLVQANQNKDYRTIDNILKLNSRFVDLFHAFSLSTMPAFNVEDHMYSYLKGNVYPDHSNSMKSEFNRHYRTAAYQTKKWFENNLTEQQKTNFRPYLLPMPLFDSRDFSFTKLVLDQARDTRKNETDAIVPYLPQIRSEGHFRLNQIIRLRTAFLKAVEQAKKQADALPLKFQYNEPERVGERFYFRLWDKPSFVLYHRDQYSEHSIKAAKKKTVLTPTKTITSLRNLFKWNASMKTRKSMPKAYGSRRLFRRMH
jgi:hypothetical protein